MREFVNRCPLVLIGGGGHALSVMDCLSSEVDVAGYVDIKETDFLDIPLMADDENFLSETSPAEYQVLITAVSGKDCSLALRRNLIERYRHYDSPVVVAKTASVSSNAGIGSGTVVLNMAVVNACASVGCHSILNTGSIVEHNCKIGNNVFIGPGSVVCGGAEIGDNVYLGAGVVVRPGVKICSDACVGLGAAVVKDITAPGKYAGIPARLLQNK